MPNIAKSDTVLFAGSGTSTQNSPQPLAASALFSLTGTQLTVTFTNAAGTNSNKYANPDVLTAVFFGTTGLTLTPVSATAPETVDNTGAPVCSTGTCDVGTGWEYATGFSQYGTMNGISAAGFGIFGNSNFGLPSMNVDGVDYGILPSNYPGTLGTSVNGSPFEVSSVNFTLTVQPGFTLASIDRVVFQYGSALNEDSFVGVRFAPEPSALLLLTGGLIALAIRRGAGRPAV
jgi:hypothetical protein